MDENRLLDAVQAFFKAMAEKATVDATYGVMYSGDLVVFSFGNERYIVPPEQVRDMRATVDGGRDIARNLIRRYMANNKPAECPECDVFSGTATIEPVPEPASGPDCDVSEYFYGEPKVDIKTTWVFAFDPCPPVKESCDRCRFWSGGQSWTRAFCRCRPPVPQGMVSEVYPDTHEQSLQAAWPITGGDDWCGEFQAK